MPLMNVINNFGFGVIAVFGGSLAVKGIISVGVIASFISYSKQFSRPLNELANTFNTLQSGIAGAERVFEILDEEDNFKAKGDIFSKRTIVKAKIIEHVDTSLEALVLSVSQRGRVDLDYMSRLTDKSKNDLIDELRGEIFLNLAEYDPFSNRLPFQNARNEDFFLFIY